MHPNGSLWSPLFGTTMHRGNLLPNVKHMALSCLQIHIRENMRDYAVRWAWLRMTTPYSRGWKQNLVPDIPDIGFLLDFEKNAKLIRVTAPLYWLSSLTSTRDPDPYTIYKLLPTVDFTDEIWLPIKGHQPDQSNEQTIWKSFLVPSKFIIC